MFSQIGKPLDFLCSSFASNSLESNGTVFTGWMPPLLKHQNITHSTDANQEKSVTICFFTNT